MDRTEQGARKDSGGATLADASAADAWSGHRLNQAAACWNASATIVGCPVAVAHALFQRGPLTGTRLVDVLGRWRTRRRSNCSRPWIAKLSTSSWRSSRLTQARNSGAVPTTKTGYFVGKQR